MARRALVVLVLLLAAPGTAAAAEPQGPHPAGGGWHLSGKGASHLDAVLAERAEAGAGVSAVIVRTADGVSAAPFIRACGGTPGRRFASISAQLADLPDRCLSALAAQPGVLGVSLDRGVAGALQRTTRATVGAAWVVEQLGVDGSGIGVAIIDSGVAASHEDLQDRVVHFADFVGRQPAPQAYDDYGHGTHVAGIIAGGGQSAGGGRRGIAPGAHLVALKALDANGGGSVSHVIAALDYAVRHRRTFNIRVINLSVAAGVHESYTTDPLTLAARRAVDAGIVVVTAAGNLGRDAAGAAQYGGITAPGNAPWVLTVGAFNDHGTVDRRDDTVASFSSRGPSLIDAAAKPDLVAPGVGIESLTDAGSYLYQSRPTARRWGTVRSATEPYLAMSGTSMAAPIAAGVVALMLEVNPSLSPAQVTAILRRTAEPHGGYDRYTQGAGFLNARAAVELARTLAAGSAPGDGTAQ